VRLIARAAIVTGGTRDIGTATSVTLKEKIYQLRRFTPVMTNRQMLLTKKRAFQFIKPMSATLLPAERASLKSRLILTRSMYW
jgi:hypothetical protein